MTEFYLDYVWKLVELRPGVAYQFPEPVSSHLSQNLAGPAVYLWKVKSGDRVVGLYVGEASDLPRRLKGYLKPGPSQTTNLRMNTLLLGEVDSGYTLELSTLHFEPFQFGGATFNQRDLAMTSVRRFLERLFESSFRKAGFNVLNA